MTLKPFRRAKTQCDGCGDDATESGFEFTETNCRNFIFPAECHMSRDQATLNGINESANRFQFETERLGDVQTELGPGVQWQPEGGMIRELCRFYADTVGGYGINNE